MALLRNCERVMYIHLVMLKLVKGASSLITPGPGIKVIQSSVVSGLVLKSEVLGNIRCTSEVE